MDDQFTVTRTDDCGCYARSVETAKENKERWARFSSHRDCAIDEHAPAYVLAWPEAMQKAATDNPWIYAFGLRDGTIMQISGIDGASSDGSWIFVALSDLEEPAVMGHAVAALTNPDRGVWVRVSDIVWFCDAPHSS